MQGVRKPAEGRAGVWAGDGGEELEGGSLGEGQHVPGCPV